MEKLTKAELYSNIFWCSWARNIHNPVDSSGNWSRILFTILLKLVKNGGKADSCSLNPHPDYLQHVLNTLHNVSYKTEKTTNENKSRPLLVFGGGAVNVRRLEGHWIKACKLWAQRNAPPELQIDEKPNSADYFVCGNLLFCLQHQLSLTMNEDFWIVCVNTS